jgi:hypothetical protein
MIVRTGARHRCAGRVRESSRHANRQDCLITPQTRGLNIKRPWRLLTDPVAITPQKRGLNIGVTSAHIVPELQSPLKKRGLNIKRPWCLLTDPVVITPQKRGLHIGALLRLTGRHVVISSDRGSLAALDRIFALIDATTIANDCVNCLRNRSVVSRAGAIVVRSESPAQMAESPPVLD